MDELLAAGPDAVGAEFYRAHEARSPTKAAHRSRRARRWRCFSGRRQATASPAGLLSAVWDPWETLPSTARISTDGHLHAAAHRSEGSRHEVGTTRVTPQGSPSSAAASSAGSAARRLPARGWSRAPTSASSGRVRSRAGAWARRLRPTGRTRSVIPTSRSSSSPRPTMRSTRCRCAALEAGKHVLVEKPARARWRRSTG